MAKFSFELEEVLKIRQFEQSQAESQLAQSIAQENKINDDIKTIAMQFASSKEQVKNSSNFDDILAHNQYSRLLDYQKECLLEELTKVKLVSEERRKVVLECMKKTNALQKMKDVKLDEFNTEQKTKEKKRIQELANIKVHDNKIPD